MAMTSAGALVSAAVQAMKQRWNASASSVAKMSPRGSWPACRWVGPEAAQEIELLLAEPRDR